MDKNVELKIRGLAAGEEFRRNPCFYLYDSADISRKLDLLGRRPGNVSLYYAMKANSNPDIMRLVAGSPDVDGIEIASVGELEKALQVVPAEKIIYTGPGKTPYELERAVGEGIRLINIESPVEAQRISQAAERLGRKDVGCIVRINTNFHIDDAITNMAGESTKMGIDEDALLPALSRIYGMPRLDPKGFHVFSASGVLDKDNLLGYADYVFGLVKRIEGRTGRHADIIDFGGGFGIDYSGRGESFGADGYFQGLSERIGRSGLSDRELILELGRYVVGESGYYVAEIIDIKESKGKKHIVAAGGVNHLRLPSASGVNQPVHILPQGREPVIPGQYSVNDEIVDVGGPLCFSEDKLAHDVRVPHAEIGDLLVVSQAGAYGYSVSSLELLSHPKPPEYVVDCSK